MADPVKYEAVAASIRKRLAEADEVALACREERADLVRKMRADGVTWTEIGRLFKVSPQRASKLTRPH